MAPLLLLRLQDLVVRSAPAPALDQDIIPGVGWAPVLENEDILREILIRLSPLPSSLLRASLVCKRWRGILSDPGFLRRFRAHHRTTPPLLGFFTTDKGHKVVFTPLLRPPNRTPTDRFSLPHQRGPLFVGAVRHGLVLIHKPLQLEAVVWDPVTGSQLTVPYAPDFRVGCPDYNIRGAVLRTTADDGDGCLDTHREERQWPHDDRVHGCLRIGDAKMEPDQLNRDSVFSFVVSSHHPGCHVVRTQDGGLGLAKLSATIIQLWGRRAHGDADAQWVLQKTVNLDRLVFPLLCAAATSVRKFHFPRIVGYDEDNNVIHVGVNTCVFTVNLETLQYTKVEEVPSSFASQNEEITSWCNLFSRSKRASSAADHEHAPGVVR
ncbi:hypothetical protein EJB05_35120 [Eragrostis curvula]|uniref:F-box domain-containing protein n=1 Tax=Eragrostis curvula TaxID=38414 RepID=A0A5J9U693_9POAL|nr:hypothetical protein EJB05_35120 [Eragrostis curvula]